MNPEILTQHYWTIFLFQLAHLSVYAITVVDDYDDTSLTAYTLNNLYIVRMRYQMVTQSQTYSTQSFLVLVEVQYRKDLKENETHFKNVQFTKPRSTFCLHDSESRPIDVFIIFYMQATSVFDSKFTH